MRIKICGITSVQDARAAAQSGADFIGLNFYPPSPRCVGAEIDDGERGRGGEGESGEWETGRSGERAIRR